MKKFVSFALPLMIAIASQNLWASETGLKFPAHSAKQAERLEEEFRRDIQPLHDLLKNYHDLSSEAEDAETFLTELVSFAESAQRSKSPGSFYNSQNLARAVADYCDYVTKYWILPPVGRAHESIERSWLHQNDRVAGGQDGIEAQSAAFKDFCTNRSNPLLGHVPTLQDLQAALAEIKLASQSLQIYLVGRLSRELDRHYALKANLESR